MHLLILCDTFGTFLYDFDNKYGVGETLSSRRYAASAEQLAATSHYRIYSGYDRQGSHAIVIVILNTYTFSYYCNKGMLMSS